MSTAPQDDDATAMIAAQRGIHEASADFRAYRTGLIAEQAVAFIIRTAQGDAAKVASVLAAALEDLGAGMPELSALSVSLRADADWWADVATPVEVEAVTAAGLRRIGAGPFALAARKRILALMWTSLTDDDRRAFLARVDPRGKFRGRGAA